jgi:hypothetical protein
MVGLLVKLGWCVLFVFGSLGASGVWYDVLERQGMYLANQRHTQSSYLSTTVQCFTRRCLKVWSDNRVYPWQI